MNKTKKIAIGSDHGGFELKNEVINYLQEIGWIYKDFGAYDTKPTHYPDYALRVGKAVIDGEYQCGILICGTGIGCLSLPIKKEYRASLCPCSFSAQMAKEHNNANVLTMGQSN